MRLTERAGKDLLSRHGLTIPEGKVCASAEEARDVAFELGCAVFVKAQVMFGDRVGLGLVVRADSADAAADAAAQFLGRSVGGKAVDSVLIERETKPDLSVYISVHVDDAASARVLRIGRGGGSRFNADEALISESVPVGGIEMFELRGLIGRLGLRGPEREAVARAAGAILDVASRWHAYTVEVNPLFVVGGLPVAVDAKVELDDYSLGLVPDRSQLPELEESEPEREARSYHESDHRGSLRYVQLVDPGGSGGNGSPLVGSHSVGGGESMVVFDALAEAGLTPANYCDTSGAPSREKVATAARLIASQPHIDAYFFSSCIANQPLSVTAAGLIDGFEEAGWRGCTLVRIAGNEDQEAQRMIADWADEAGVDATVIGRDVDEWQAALMLADTLRNGGHGWRS